MLIPVPGMSLIFKTHAGLVSVDFTDEERSLRQGNCLAKTARRGHGAGVRIRRVTCSVSPNCHHIFSPLVLKAGLAATGKQS